LIALIFVSPVLVCFVWLLYTSLSQESDSSQVYSPCLEKFSEKDSGDLTLGLRPALNLAT